MLRTARALLAAAAAVTVATGAATSAYAASAPLSHPTVLAHLDITKGQLPENITLDTNGSVDVTFAGARQVARISGAGTVSVLATLPAPTEAEGKSAPVLHFPITSGLVRTPAGTLYALYAAGSASLNGLWEITPGAAPRRVAALSAGSLPNGLALSEDSRVAYAADSVLGVVYSIRLRDGAVRTWSSDPLLRRTEFLGANGIKVRHGSVWVSNLDLGTVVRIPIVAHGHAGGAKVAARGLKGIDDFAFTGKGDELLAAMDQPNYVALVVPGHGSTSVLSAADGLQGPTSIAVRGSKVYVPSAAYNTQQDPNVLVATISGR